MALLRRAAAGFRGAAGRILLLIILLALGSEAAAVRAQALPASPFLSPDHWVHDVLLRTGAAERSIAVRGRRTLTWCEAARALSVGAAASGRSAEQAASALELLRQELPLIPGAACALEPIDAAAAAGLYQRTGALQTSTGTARTDPSWGPPVPLDDVSAATAGVQLAGAAGSRLAGILEAGHLGGEWQVQTLHATGAVGPVLLWAGRRPVGFGPGHGGGLVFGDDAAVTGAGLQSGVPLLGPGFLRHLGPFHFETFLARGGPSGEVADPWLWGARASIHPHPRLLLAVNRGALFGGEGNVAMSFRDLLYIAIGKHASGGSALENQIVAVELVYAPPLPFPTEAYIEWGLEDSAGAWRDTPGVLWGIAFSDLPGLAGARVGVEHTEFAVSCCGNPMWYRHWSLAAGWTTAGRPMGHPLGGHGEEWLLFGSGGLLDQRLQLDASVAFRDRRHENLYAPDREGGSHALRVGTAWVAGRWRAGVQLFSEAGEDWGQTLFATTVKVRF